MKKGKSLIILIVVLIAVAAGYFAMNSYNQAQQETEETSVTVADNTEKTVKEIRWTANENEYVFTSNDGEDWTYSADDKFPVDESSVSTAADTLTAVSAIRSVTEKASDLSEYGLESPAYSLKITFTDGSSTEYSIGSYNDFASGYYMKTGDSDTVYLVDSSLADVAEKTEYDFVKYDELPQADTINSLTVGDKYEINYYAGGKDGYYTDAYEYFLDDTQAAKNDEASELFTDVKALEWGSCVDYCADTAALKKYGLTDALAQKISYAYTLSDGNSTKGSFTLLVGKTDDAGDYYVRTANSVIVSTMSQSSISPLLDCSKADLIAKDVCLVKEEQVDSFTVLYDGTEYAFTTETQDDETEIHRVNGKETELYSSFLTDLIALKGEKYLDENAKASDKAVLSVAYNIGTEKLSFSIFKYKDGYVSLFNGSSTLVLNETELDGIITDFESLTQEQTEAEETTVEITEG